MMPRNRETELLNIVAGVPKAKQQHALSPFF